MRALTPQTSRGGIVAGDAPGAAIRNPNTTRIRLTSTFPFFRTLTGRGEHVGHDEEPGENLPLGSSLNGSESQRSYAC